MRDYTKNQDIAKDQRKYSQKNPPAFSTSSIRTVQNMAHQTMVEHFKISSLLVKNLLNKLHLPGYISEDVTNGK